MAASWLTAGFVLGVCTEASAVTLKLAFSDGLPMTYGSACSGAGCLQSGAGVQSTDAAGAVVLAEGPDRIVEYRRDGVDLSQALPGSASGAVEVSGEQTTVVLPRMLAGSAPAVDAVESDMVARINAERRARGLPLAALDQRLSTAADLHATWLSSSAVGLLPVLTHVGPFGTTLAFRLGEVSFPEPENGAEIIAAGSTPAGALSLWLASPVHREQVLAPGALLIGAGSVGGVIVVDTHASCAGCRQAPAAGSGVVGSPAPGSAPAGTGTSAGAGSPVAPDASALGGSSAGRVPACGSERLRVRRLRSRPGRLRLRVSVGCLRAGAAYKLTVIQRPSGAVLKTRNITRPGAVTLALRPLRRTRTVRIKLKRNGRAVAARTTSTRRR